MSREMIAEKFWIAGGFMALTPTVNIELVGIEKVSRAQGLVQVALGFPAMIAMALGGECGHICPFHDSKRIG